jgi:threonine/homoserine/homoserine lactone efflux protein
MTTELLFSLIAGGMLYVLVPGPATLAALNYSATSGRFATAKFLAAHLLGDLVWSILAILAIIGVSRLGPGLFDALGVVCGLYLIWLGAKALRAKESGSIAIGGDPVRVGLIFGLTNPKAYPFALAMFTALIGRFGDAVAAASLPGVLAAVFVGFVLADLIVVAWTGLAPIRRAFARHGRIVARATGILFILFGAKSLHDALSSSARRS